MEAATAGAHSVFRFIERTAEPQAEGYRWQTIDDLNKPQYHYMLFNGCGGISLFLAEYYGLTGADRALELAVGANQWCALPEHEGYARGLHTGRTGVALSWLHLAGIAGEPAYRAYPVEHAELLLAEDPGPVTDLMGGAASTGLFLIRLWQATGEHRHLDGAVRNGRWLGEQLVRDRLGCYCLMYPEQKDAAPYAGAAHGIAGVAQFFLLLYEATGDDLWAGYANEILATLIRHAQPDRGGLNWGWCLGQTELDRCQWSHGAVGIGLVFAKAYALLDDSQYRDTALQAGTAAYAYGDFRRNATQCIGLAGSGELFIELYGITQDQIWLDRAYEFAERALAYRELLPAGDAWPTDEPGLFSADYMYGAAGIGHFFLRLWKPGEIPMPLM